MDSKPTEQLAHFAASFSYDALPQSAREHARHLLLDSIACAIAGDFGDETAPYAAFARIAGGEGDSTVIGMPDRLSLLGASLLNGYLVTTVTLCDTYLPAHVHISPEVVPPALAVAERDHVDGRSLLAAIALGAEVAVRVAGGIDYSVAGKRGWHFPGIVGPFGAAAAVGRLRGLTPLQMRNAFGLAGSQAAGTWASWGSPAVKFHQSRGGASGLLAATLAEEDFASSAEILAHPDGGIFAAYSDGGKPEAITAELGKRYEFEEIALRLWPGATPAQSTLTAVFNLVAAHRPQFKEIAEVRLDVAPHVYDAHARFVQPEGKFEALLSYHFMVAKILRDGKLWLDSLSPDQVGDPALRAFMRENIVLSADPSLTFGKGRASIVMKNGATLTEYADAARGAPGNRATTEDLHEKYRLCVAGRLSDVEADELFEGLMNIEDRGDIGRIFQLLGTAKPRIQ
jgi:2-methylcitrate dehydratase PrpD